MKPIDAHPDKYHLLLISQTPKGIIYSLVTNIYNGAGRNVHIQELFLTEMLTSRSISKIWFYLKIFKYYTVNFKGSF